MQETQEMQVWSLGQQDTGVGNGNPLLYSSLEIAMDRWAWQAVYSPLVTKSQTGLSIHAGAVSAEDNSKLN